MRVNGGYGGPVSHWWRDSLRYAGPGLDWRYEGIIHGYLNLYETTDNEQWLEVARVAGQDLVSGQLESGNYRASAFERNPEFGGTPHEACASAALLRLARTCRTNALEWEPYAATARRNLEWHIEALWDEAHGTFSDTPGMRSYVPNKIASTVDALCRFVRFTDEETFLVAYARPAAETVVSLQVESGQHRGGIHQLSRGGVNRERHGDGKFFPLYIARCVPPLLSVSDLTGDERFVDAAVDAGEFLERVEHENGSFPQVVYQNGRRNDGPQWIAGVGDMLRAYDTLNDRGYDFSTEATEAWLRSGFDECGGFRTAQGFGQLIGQSERPVLQDVLHVVGWNDKAFRWLTRRADDVVSEATNTESSVSCTFDDRSGVFVENDDRIEFRPNRRQKPAYSWDKHSRWTRRNA